MKFSLLLYVILTLNISYAQKYQDPNMKCPENLYKFYTYNEEQYKALEKSVKNASSYGSPTKEAYESIDLLNLKESISKNFIAVRQIYFDTYGYKEANKQFDRFSLFTPDIYGYDLKIDYDGELFVPLDISSESKIYQVLNFLRSRPGLVEFLGGNNFVFKVNSPNIDH